MGEIDWEKRTRDSLVEDRVELVKFADKHHLRLDWHEPDEQSIDARFTGWHLDNAMGNDPRHNSGEMTVILKHLDSNGNEDDRLEINLATLLALATEPYRANKV
jgi:hypothetical protein